MNSRFKIAFVAAFASLALAGVSRAESIAMNTAPEIAQTLRAFNSDFNLRYVGNWDNDPEHETRGLSATGRTDNQLRAIRASISENKDLVRKLNQDDVKVDNIVDAEQAADGSVTFFVR
jgi:hypothetical protein